MRGFGEVSESVFPFLIGRIRTSNFLATASWQGEFPFLIGRIRTKRDIYF